MRLPLRWMALLLGVVCFSNLLQAADWPQWRGPGRNAQSEEHLASTDWEKTPPQHLWTASGFGEGYASVAIVKGTLYTLGNTEGGQAVIAAKADDGGVLWKKVITDADPKHDHKGSRCTPSVDGDRLYVVTSNGSLACLKINNGDVLWQRQFSDWSGKMMSGWGYSESPLVDGERVLCTPGGPDALVVCLDKMTGKEIWACKAAFEGNAGKDGAGYSSIVVSDALGIQQYVQLTGKGLIGIRAHDGKQLWMYNRVANGVANIPTPIVDGNRILASTSYKTGTCLVELKKDGEKIVPEEKYFLDFKVFNNHHGGMILFNGHIYAGHQQNEGFPTCVNMASGDVVWGGDLRGPGKGSAAVLYIDGHLIFRYQDGTVALIEATPTAYHLKGSFTPDFQAGNSWAHPVVVQGRLYLREQDKLMCYQVGE
ncbi:MAG: PQQ-like beta-propeller repeat protein [Planctomycetales bacterium]|nr:PQQ-like beta-propeller repeat protein [Planctomycetales bacterium]